MDKQTGWKPIPLTLKILMFLMILWAIGSIFNMPNLYAFGLPLFGVFVKGALAVLIAFIIDILGPIIFIYALWNRKSWGPIWALIYIGFFILNSIVAIFTVLEVLGLMPILIPLIVSTIFLIIIFVKRDYFQHSPSK